MNEVIVFLLVGVCIGAAVSILIYWLMRNQIKLIQSKLKDLQEDNRALQEKVMAAQKQYQEEMRNATLYKSERDNAEKLLEDMRSSLQAKISECEEKGKGMATLEAEKKTLEKRLEDHQNELLSAKNEMNLAFKDIANSILKENTKTFADSSEKNINDILQPLKNQIDDFKKQVKESYDRDHDDTLSLKNEINNIVLAGNKLSADAQNLTSALKSNHKIQGNWGEIQLERLLQMAGLERDVHYVPQEHYKDENGCVRIPDFVVKLPDNKNYVIDSKVSLVAYERFFNTEDESERVTHLNQHIKNIKEHIDELSKKHYEAIYGINSPDYVFMFMPIEPALTQTLQKDPDLYAFALSKNVVLVSSTLLLATLRTVSFIWKQENQREYVQKIAEEGGNLHDRFIELLEEIRKIGTSLKSCNTAYRKAVNKLNDSPKYSTTLMSSIERLEHMGASGKKKLEPKTAQFLNQEDDVVDDGAVPE